MERGRILLWGSAADMERGISLLGEGGSVVDDPPRRAEASILAARGEIALGLASQGIDRLTRLATDPTTPEEWSDRGISLLLDTVSGGGGEITPLAEMAERYRESAPRIAAWCWNRIGDIHLRRNERAAARDAYRTVIERIPPAGSATAAARFALAELLYQEERFAEAKGLYETELAERPEESSIYLLARRAYLRKSWGGVSSSSVRGRWLQPAPSSTTSSGTMGDIWRPTAGSSRRLRPKGRLRSWLPPTGRASPVTPLTRSSSMPPAFPSPISRGKNPLSRQTA